MTVPAAHAWPSNAEMIEGAARLGHLKPEWLTLDSTYGLGIFWKRWRPAHLIRHDINPLKAPDGVADFTRLPYADRTFGAVVFDGPYKLNGTPDLDEMDRRYGVDVPARWQDRMDLLIRGTREAARVLGRGNLLVKCQDQVCSGKVRWQTDILRDVAQEEGLVKIDEMMLLGTGRPQPESRPHRACGGQGCTEGGCLEGHIPVVQRHAAFRPSTLLIFRKG